MPAVTIGPVQTQLIILLRMLIAMALGAVMGLDRELADKPAGLRTHMLVAGAAALFVPLGTAALQQFAGQFGTGVVSADPVRIIESIVAGVSFLGAGTIIHSGHGEAVEGLTTAASLLFTSGVGVAVAVGHIILAIGATALAFLTLTGLGMIERKVRASHDE